MKILALEFKNINSLKGEHRIDFTAEEFSQNPLFAITGPTGSGKTTLLDVISLALFGEVPRLGKISRSMVAEKGAVLTRNQEEAFAKVIYHCSDGQFASVWQISTARTGNLRDYEMELTKLHPLQRLDLKKSEIPAKNEELIGLSYDQFIKSVVLAQGEFSKFLRAAKKERSELLEKITGTGIYRELGMEAYRKYVDKNKAIEQEEQIVAAHKEKILPKDERAKEEQKLRIVKERMESLVKKKDRLKEQLRLQKELAELQLGLKKKGVALAVQRKEQEAFADKFGEPMRRHERVEEFSIALRDSENQEKYLSELRKEGETLARQKVDFEKAKENQLQKVCKFIQSPVEEEELMLSLDAFYKKVHELQEKIKDLEQEYRSQRKAFHREIEGLELKNNGDFFVTQPSRWESLLEKHENAKSELKQYFKNTIPADMEKYLETYKMRLQLLRSAQKEQGLIDDLQREMATNKKLLQRVEEELKKAPKVVEKLAHKVELGEKEVENLELRFRNQLMTAKVEDLRVRLNAGEPCPVCGAKEHPYAIHAPQRESGLEIKIKAAKKELKQNGEALIRHRTEVKNLQKRQIELQKQLSRDKEKQNIRIVAFQEAYKGNIQIEENDWKIKISAAERKIEELYRYKKIQQEQEQIERAKPVFERLFSIYTEAKAVRKEIGKYYSGKDVFKDYQSLQMAWQDSKRDLKTVTVRIKEHAEKLKKGKQALEVLLDELLPKLQEKGFTGVKEAQDALLSGSAYKELRQTREKFEKLITELVSGIQTEENRKKQLANQLHTSQSQEELEVQLEKNEREIKEETIIQKEIERRLKNDEELQEEIRQLEKRIQGRQAENLRWKWLRNLIGDAKGDRFNQFAQDLTLRHLLTLANRRLKHISGRYQLQIKTEVGEKSDNLVVADLDMGGQERAVQTLSGGETFLMSLALALALSDLASKNVQINSLFIDEGFGTLDPETLDQTLDTLERLQASSHKTIGIISHVASLKERIATQIQLARNGQGYSSLKIVSA